MAPITIFGWAAAAIATNPATLRLLINGSQVRPDFPLPGVAGSWTNFMAVWHSGTNTNATLAVIDTSIVNHGNDFALDDLTFRESTGILAPVPVMLIAPGASWKYLEDGSEPGTGWAVLGYNDNNWKSGTAQFGYGEGDESTVLRSNRTDGSVIQTFYFRKTLVLTNAWALTNAGLGLMRDDGAVVYLNGTEIFRSNMTNGPIYYTNWAMTAVGGADENTFYQTNVPSTGLRNGTNVVAVEIHQAAGNSSDVSFDFWLSAVMHGKPSLTYLRAGSSLEFTWSTFPGGFELESSPALGAGAAWGAESSGSLTNGMNKASIPMTPNGDRFFRLRRP